MMRVICDNRLKFVFARTYILSSYYFHKIEYPTQP